MSLYDQLDSVRISNQLIETELKGFWGALAEYESFLFLAEDYADQIIQDQSLLKQEMDEICSGLIRLQDLQAKVMAVLHGIK